MGPKKEIPARKATLRMGLLHAKHGHLGLGRQLWLYKPALCSTLYLVRAPQQAECECQTCCATYKAVCRVHYNLCRLMHIVLNPAGSTELWEFDKETMDDAISLHDKLLRSYLREYSGYEVATEGDAFLIAFHEATDAIKWCIAVQKVRQRTVRAAECLSRRSTVSSRGRNAWPDLHSQLPVVVLSCVMLFCMRNH